MTVSEKDTVALGPALRLTAQPFDSAFLGGPVYRLAGGTTLGHDDVRKVEAWAEGTDAALVIARAASPDAAAFAGSRFRRVETLVTLERSLANAPASIPAGIRFSRPEDAEACADIAAASFTDDRYHADPNTVHAADAIKAAWARNDVQGRADAGFVAVSGRAIIGFNLCLLGNGVASIDLIATSSAWRGRGFGRALVRAALAHYRERARVMQVGTQATNTASLALYRAEGFAEVARADTWHLTPAGVSGHETSRAGVTGLRA